MRVPQVPVDRLNEAEAGFDWLQREQTGSRSLGFPVRSVGIEGEAGTIGGPWRCAVKSCEMGLQQAERLKPFDPGGILTSPSEAVYYQLHSITLT